MVHKVNDHYSQKNIDGDRSTNKFIQIEQEECNQDDVYGIDKIKFKKTKIFHGRSFFVKLEKTIGVVLVVRHILWLPSHRVREEVEPS